IGGNIEPEGSSGDFQQALRRYGLDPEIPVLAYFGMSYPGKGMSTLFEVTRMLLERGHPIQLLVIGGGISDVPEYIEEKRQLTSRLGIEGRVIWTGRIPAEDVSALLDASRLALLPYDSGVSDRRGSLMAALAHGRAVVTTRPAVPVALFKNRENMIWPETGEAGALAGAVSELLEDRALLGRLERGARALAAHYKWPEIAIQTKDFFQEIVTRKRG
ncbi:MAG: glycosyltransferase family 4 protein, partial [Pseudomonadota bacterium]